MRRALATVTLLLLAAPAFAAGNADKVGALYQRSYDLEAAAKYSDALKAHGRLPTAEKQTYVYQLRLAWLSYLAGKYDDSVEAYKAASKVAPKAIEPVLGRTLPEMALRRWRAVIETSGQVLERDPGNTVARSRRGLAKYSQGRYKDAAADYETVLEAYPSDTDIRTGLGWSLLKMGKTKEAARHFEAVLRVAPKHASAREGLLLVGGSE